MSVRITHLCIDSHSPASIAGFWTEALGWRVTSEESDEVVIEPPQDNPGFKVTPAILFLRVPRGKTVKNRLHIDLRPDDRDVEVARLEALGARKTDIGQGEPTWVVMANPEGNEFCVLRALTPEEIAVGAT